MPSDDACLACASWDEYTSDWLSDDEQRERAKLDLQEGELTGLSISLGDGQQLVIGPFDNIKQMYRYCTDGKTIMETNSVMMQAFLHAAERDDELRAKRDLAREAEEGEKHGAVAESSEAVQPQRVLKKMLQIDVNKSEYELLGGHIFGPYIDNKMKYSGEPHSLIRMVSVKMLLGVARALHLDLESYGLPCEEEQFSTHGKLRCLAMAIEIKLQRLVTKCLEMGKSPMRQMPMAVDKIHQGLAWVLAEAVLSKESGDGGQRLLMLGDAQARREALASEVRALDDDKGIKRLQRASISRSRLSKKPLEKKQVLWQEQQAERSLRVLIEELVPDKGGDRSSLARRANELLSFGLQDENAYDWVLVGAIVHGWWRQIGCPEVESSRPAEGGVANAIKWLHEIQLAHGKKQLAAVASASVKGQHQGQVTTPWSCGFWCSRSAETDAKTTRMTSSDDEDALKELFPTTSLPHEEHGTYVARN